MKNKFYLIIIISVFMLSACASGMPKPMIINNNNYEQLTLPQADPDVPAPNYFRVSMLEEEAAQPIKTFSTALKVSVKKSIVATTKKIYRVVNSEKTILARLSNVERYAKENRNRIGTLKKRFDLSDCGKIQAEMILFLPGSSKLSQAGKNFLNILAAGYLAGDVANIVVDGNASLAKGKIDNKILSLQRAETVCNYLAEKSVPATIINVGETEEYGINTNAMITWLQKR